MADERGLAGSVLADDRDAFAASDRKVDAVERPGFAVVDVDEPLGPKDRLR